MNKRHYEHTLPNIRGSLSNTYFPSLPSTLQSRIVLGMSIGSKITMKSGNTPIQCGT